MNNKMENSKEIKDEIAEDMAMEVRDEIAEDMAMALISYVEAHLMETVGWYLDGTEFDNDDDFFEMQGAVVSKLIGMLSHG